MKPITRKWCVQIDVTNACGKQCSNCTRLTAHCKSPFFMTLDRFEQAVQTVQTFPEDSEADEEGRSKVVGLIGGDPPLHPQFEELCQVMLELIPRKKSRGMWCNERSYEKNRDLIDRVFGYKNIQSHDPPSVHQPMLVASEDLVENKELRYHFIQNCWLQDCWAASITPKGCFFCEVAGTLDMVFDGPGGLPMQNHWWERSLRDFHGQVHRWCNRCGICMPLPGRKDCEEIDDVSKSNYERLKEIGSPALDRCKVYDCSGYDPADYIDSWKPRKYRDIDRDLLMSKSER